MLRVLGSDLEPTCEDSGKRTIERLMMPSEPSLKRSGDAPETKKRGDAGDARAVPGAPGGAGTPGTDYFYDAETPTTFAESSFRARDHFYDAETSTPERLPAATTPFATPAGEPDPDPEPDPVEEEADWIARAREAAVASLLRRGGPRRGDRDTAKSGWGEMLAGSPATPGETASTKKRLAFRTPEATPPFKTPSAEERRRETYAPSEPARREIESLAKSLRL